MAKGMLIATSMCLGCNACTVECKRNNNVPVGQHIHWTSIEEHEVGTYPDVVKYFIKDACKHCTQASCMDVCPTGAISKPDGAHVVIDQDWCIGCGYCAMACPFDIPHLGEPKGPAQKCMFCYAGGLVDDQTACAAACPFGAITYGDRDELIAKGKERVAALQAKGVGKARLYGEHELGGLHVLYVLEDEAPIYGLPESPRHATANVVGQWLSGIVTAGVVAAVPFWLLFKRQRAAQANPETNGGGE